MTALFAGEQIAAAFVSGVVSQNSLIEPDVFRHRALDVFFQQESRRNLLVRRARNLLM